MTLSFPFLPCTAALAERHADTHVFFTLTVFNKKTGELCDIDLAMLDHEKEVMAFY